MYLIMRCTFLMVTVTLYSLVESKCPSLFEEFNKACYYYGNNQVATPEDAKRTCGSLGGYLLNVDADLENSHTIDRLKAQSTVFDGYWIGGKYDNNNRIWVWERADMNGRPVIEYMNPEESQYANWGPGQPDAIVGFEYRPYVAIMVRYRVQPWAWYSETRLNNLRMSYVCEAYWKEDV
ncbi:carbohydrate binding [Mactra antiquata]